jgi:hypothetical protein
MSFCLGILLWRQKDRRVKRPRTFGFRDSYLLVPQNIPINLLKKLILFPRVSRLAALTFAMMNPFGTEKILAWGNTTSSLYHFLPFSIIQTGQKLTSLVARSSRGRCAQHLHDIRGLRTWRTSYGHVPVLILQNQRMVSLYSMDGACVMPTYFLKYYEASVFLKEILYISYTQWVPVYHGHFTALLQ